MRSLVFVLLMVLTLPASAALRYLIVTETVKEDDTDVNAELVTADGDNARVDIVKPDGIVLPNGGFLVTNDGGQSIAISDGGSAVCGAWTTAEFYDAAGRVAEKGRKTVKADLKDVSTAKVLDEPGPEMLGYPTNHVRLESHYGAMGKFMFIKFDYEVKETFDLWMTNELDMPQVEQYMVDASTQSGFDYVDQLTKEYNAFLTGTVLKEVKVVRLINVRSGKEEMKTVTMEVKSVEILDSVDIPPQTFQVPDCKPVSKKQMEKRATRMLKKQVK